MLSFHFLGSKHTYHKTYGLVLCENPRLFKQSTSDVYLIYRLNSYYYTIKNFLRSLAL